MQENCTGKGNLTWNNTNKKTKEKNTGAQEERTEMSQVPSLQRWYDAYKVHVSYSCGQHPRAGSGCHHAGHGTAAGASHSGGKGKMRNSTSVPGTHGVSIPASKA